VLNKKVGELDGESESTYLYWAHKLVGAESDHLNSLIRQRFNTIDPSTLTLRLESEKTISKDVLLMAYLLSANFQTETQDLKSGYAALLKDGGIVTDD
jgi:hypothetical protein